MSVGGRIIEIADTEVPGLSQPCARIWVVDARRSSSPGFGDETCIDVVKSESMPALGDEIWWQGRTVYFDNDRQTLTRVGYSYRPEAVADGRA